MNHKRENEINKIIEGCKNNNRASQNRLYELFADDLFTLCCYLLKSKHDAEDALHNAFIKIFTNIKQLKNKAALNWWLKRTVKNECLAFYRKKDKKHENKEAEIDINNFENPQNKIDDREYMRSFILQLPVKLRLVFYFRANEFSHEEISEILNITVGTSKVRYLRAKEYLIKKIKL